MRRDRSSSSWSRRRTAGYLVGVTAIWVAAVALGLAVDDGNRGVAAILVAAGMVVFLGVFTIFVIRSLREP